jgi:isopenicillin-N epimerase
VGLVTENQPSGLDERLDFSSTSGVCGDFYAGNCHKWLIAPKGSAFLHVRPERQPMINPLVISHGWAADNANPAPFGGTPFVDGIEMQGTRDPSAWLAVPDAIAFRVVHHWNRVAAECQRLVHDTAKRVAKWSSLPAF